MDNTTGNVARKWYVAVIWGCVALVVLLAWKNAMGAARRTKGAVPAVGGYSNTRKSDSPTVGIVTFLKGHAFAIANNKKKRSSILRVGSGLPKDREIWLDRETQLHFVTLDGSRVAVAGPAVFRLPKAGAVDLQRGSVRLRSSDHETNHLLTPSLKTEISGDVAAWVSPQKVQVVAIRGELKAWHPYLPEATVLVPPGAFTESTVGSQRLQPSRPLAVDPDKTQAFLGRFGENSSDDETADFHEAVRKLASEETEEPEQDLSRHRGSRTPQEVLMPADPKVMARLKAHLVGKNVAEEDDPMDDAPLAVPGGKRAPSSVRKGHAKPARGGGKPSFEIRTTGEPHDDESRELLHRMGGAR